MSIALDCDLAFGSGWTSPCVCEGMACCSTRHASRASPGGSAKIARRLLRGSPSSTRTGAAAIPVMVVARLCSAGCGRHLDTIARTHFFCSRQEAQRPLNEVHSFLGYMPSFNDALLNF